MTALLALAAAGALSGWMGTWTYDLCHEDRKADHDLRTYCRQGRDRIRIEQRPGGVIDVTRCPADPWDERDVRLDASGRRLAFRTREGLEVRLALGEDLDHFRGTFRSRDGHSGRVWGRRVDGCR